MSPVVDLLRELIAIPSVNPDGAPESGFTGEQRMAEFAGDFLRSLGADVTLEEVKPGRPNVIGRFPSEKEGKPRILLAPHLDTVTIDGMTIDPFGAEVRDGRVYGRGACDTKGTMAAMLTALRELREQVPRLGAEITFAGFMGEETGQYGSKHFAEHHPGYDFAVVGEPTGCDIVYTTKGNFWARLITSGRAVHSSAPHLGENAVVKMARVITFLDESLRPRVGDERFAHPVLGKCTMNIGLVRGGVRTNIVPDSCELQIDMRLTPLLWEHGAEKLLRDALDEAGLAGAVAVEVLIGSAPMETDPGHPMVAKLAGGKSRCLGAPWFCDAAFLAQAGIPSVAAGPGDIAQAHTADEWIAIDSLEAGVRFYRDFLEAL